MYGEQCEGPSDGCFVPVMMMDNRYAGATQNVVYAQANSGEYITATIFYRCPEKPTTDGSCDSKPFNLPVVVWLHPRSYPSGFNEGYIKSESQTAIFYALADAGYAVICFDFLGFGTRSQEYPLFYRRYPQWSLLGKMVRDDLAALDLVTYHRERRNIYDPPLELPGLDRNRIYLVGYDIGGRVALYMGALDTAHRIQGIVSINGWTLMRKDTNSSSTGGNRRLWDWHAFQPILGFFDGNETALPYNMPDVLVQASQGRAKLLIYEQLLDRENNARMYRKRSRRREKRGRRY